MTAADGGLYLIHIEPRYRHAGHYLGYADDIARRVAQHRVGGSKASPLLRAATAAGCTLSVARVWVGGSRDYERRLKNGGGLSRHCPTCQDRGLVPPSRVRRSAAVSASHPPT